MIVRLCAIAIKRFGADAMLNIEGMSKDDLAALVPQLLAALEQAQKPKALSLKVSEKGAVSIYGMGKFPVTLYREQWERIFNHRQQMIDFIKDNAKLLKSKADKGE